MYICTNKHEFFKIVAAFQVRMNSLMHLVKINMTTYIIMQLIIFHDIQCSISYVCIHMFYDVTMDLHN